MGAGGGAVTLSAPIGWAVLVGGEWMPRRTVSTTHGTLSLDDAKSRVLEGLRRGLGVGPAAEVVGYSRSQVYRWREDDPAFAAAWMDALESAADRGEGELYRRGVEGVPRVKAHLYRGKVVHRERYREYSDMGLIAWLKANRPGKYRDDQARDASAPVQVVIYLPDNGRPMGTAIQVVAPSQAMIDAPSGDPESPKP